MKKSFKSSVLILQLSKIFICLIFLVYFHLLPVTSVAEQAKPTLEEIIVTATRIEEPLKETTSTVVVIKEEEIKKMNVQFVTDVLRKIPELNLVQNGGIGGTATVLLRGGDSRHTLVMIDGVRAQDTATGSFDFSGINVDDIERIEIVKGPQSPLYGSEAMAGVINIVTKKGEGKPGVDASFGAGSYGTYKPSFTFSGGDKLLDYRFTTSYFSTGGISSARDGSEKDGYKNASFSGKFGFRPAEKVELELSGRYYYARSEFDGFDFLQRKAIDDLNYVQHGNHYILSGKGKFYLLNFWEQILTASTVKDSLKARDPDTSFNNYDIITGLDTLDWQNNFYVSDSYVLTAGAEYRRERGENKGVFEENIDNKALYMNNKLKLFKDALIINAGLRYDDHELSGNKITYRFGAMYHISPIALGIKSTYGTGFRAPALNELFFPFYGNVKLKPEESRFWEIALEKEITKGAFISLVYFEEKYKNLIQTDPLTWTAANIAEAEVKGIETKAMVKLTDKINIKAGYIYLDTEDETTGHRLTRRPKDKFNLSAEFSTKDVSTIASYIFVGERYDSSVGRNLSSYSLVNLSSTYRVTKGLDLFARIENLFDVNYEEAGTYGTLGFSFFAGFGVTL